MPRTPVRAPARTRSGVRRANQSATASPTVVLMLNAVKIYLSGIQRAKQQHRKLAKCDATWVKVKEKIKKGNEKII